MIYNAKIYQRLKTLQFNIDDVNICYNTSLNDTYIESGLEYNKSYPFNEETQKLLKKQRELEKLREDKLFSSILNFTQTFYSIKEYLKKEFPEKKTVIEDFFSNEKIGSIARKDICNDLKHNPERDLKYDTRIVDRRTSIENRTLKMEAVLSRTWFYADVDSVKHCNNLFNELFTFIEENFNN